MNSIGKTLSIRQAWGVYALYIMVAGAGAVTPALAAFGDAFPDASPVTITLVQSLPSLTCILGTLLVGSIAGRKISFKLAGIIALLIYFVFGVFPAIWNNTIEGILIMRALVGFGMGMVAPLGASVFIRLVEDKEERQRYLGRGGAFWQIGCIIMTLSGGFLCAIDWRLTFWAYALSLVSLVVFLFCFKEPELTKNSEKDQRNENKKKIKIPAAAWFFVILFTVAQMVSSPTMMTFSTLMSINIPGETATSVAGTAGILLSIFVLAGGIASAFLDKFIKVMGRFTGAFCFIVCAAGAAIIAFASSILLFAVGIIVFGFGVCLAQPLFNYECSSVTDKISFTMVASLLMVAMNVGNFAASFWLGAVYSVVGESPSTLLLVDVGLFVVLAVIWAIFNLQNNAWRKDAKER